MLCAKIWNQYHGGEFFARTFPTLKSYNEPCQLYMPLLKPGDQVIENLHTPLPHSKLKVIDITILQLTDV